MKLKMAIWTVFSKLRGKEYLKCKNMLVAKFTNAYVEFTNAYFVTEGGRVEETVIYFCICVVSSICML